MEPRKQKEIEYYDEKALEQFKNVSYKRDFEGFVPWILNSFSFCYQWLLKNCKDKKVLDFGSGNGIHAVQIAKMSPKKVIGIDLSEKSLEIAKERALKESLKGRIEFLKMDCEKMDFSDKYFDVIFDGGTFSSLDINKAYPELARVLKKDGHLIGIETFGHNPFTNLKRKINKLTGKRTSWAAEHIFKEKDLKEAGKYFNKIEVHFFHLVSWIVFPFLGLPGAGLLLKIFEAMDGILLKLPFLRKYAFKIVFVFSRPK
jgi:SAM-dependent methyltransferase